MVIKDVGLHLNRSARFRPRCRTNSVAGDRTPRRSKQLLDSLSDCWSIQFNLSYEFALPTFPLMTLTPPNCWA